MRVLFGIALAAVAVALTPVAGAQTVTECDRLASHPEDPDRVAPAVETSDLQFDAAIAACRADIVREPDNSRLHYLLGRLLFYNKQNEEAVKEVRNAADMGYRQAQFVFGAFINNKRPFAPTDICVLEDYWLKSAIAGRQAARISYVRYALRGKFDGCAHQPDRATLTSLLDAAHVGKPGYY
ncbi:MAG: hypothetical protein KDE14_10760, partial [Rhodobacteraceae bacterium]|nr:hypothetical protein [Paracoccaceae bacterium]